MLHEAMLSGGTWATFLYTSQDGLSWALLNSGKPLQSLQVAAGGMYGGPRFASINGTLTPKFSSDGLYHLWYHAASDSGGLPTDIYHASSADLITWNVTPKTPVLTHQGPATFEDDQVAGPVPLVVGDMAYLFYDGDNNSVGSCGIGMAQAKAV